MVNISTDTIYDILYIVIPSLLIVFLFYLESKYVTEHERENKEFFKIFFLSSFLLGIIQYGYRFYYDISHSKSCGGISNVSKSASASASASKSIKENIKKNIKKIPNFDTPVSDAPSIIKDTVKSIVDKVADVSSDISDKVVKTVSSPISSPSPSSLIKSISIPTQINPNLPDF